MTETNHYPINVGPSPEQAQHKLAEGNKRFVSASMIVHDMGQLERSELDQIGQKPFAVILTCSDSRVPPELIFNQGLGALFVVRVAGNVIDEIALGSLEYGVEHLGASLLVVLGHSKCGAVQTSVEGGEVPGSIAAIVNKIKPSVDKIRATGASGDELCRRVEDENIAATIDEIKKSSIIKHLLEHGELKILGAKYHLDSGEVVFM